KIKRRVFEILDRAKPGDTASRIIDIFIMTLIIVNILAIFIETFDIPQSLQHFLDIFETISVLTFTVEYILRLWVAPYQYPDLPPWRARIKYLFTFMAIVDLLAILPYYLPMYLDDLRILRIYWLIKANRHLIALRKVVKVIKAKKSELLSSLFVLFIMMMVCSILMFSFEREVQPKVFNTALDGLWYAISIFSFAWLGDIWPITIPGRILGGFMAILGMAVVAVPTGIISSGMFEDAQEEAEAAEVKETLKLLKQMKKDLDEIKRKVDKSGDKK
ncbi:MAG: ion transporter, partial [Spirochaetia bacterium]|nr:ion transporter [Spirochaetia bacterium]